MGKVLNALITLIVLALAFMLASDYLPDGKINRPFADFLPNIVNEYVTGKQDWTSEDVANAFEDAVRKATRDDGFDLDNVKDEWNTITMDQLLGGGNNYMSVLGDFSDFLKLSPEELAQLESQVDPTTTVSEWIDISNNLIDMSQGASAPSGLVSTNLSGNSSVIPSLTNASGEKLDIPYVVTRILAESSAYNGNQPVPVEKIIPSARISDVLTSEESFDHTRVELQKLLLLDTRETNEIWNTLSMQPTVGGWIDVVEKTIQETQ